MGQRGSDPAFEDREQVARLCSRSESLGAWSHRLLDIGAMEDAIEFSRAANAAAYSAEHLCRKWYVTQTEDVH